jgi:hypothetical protein
VEVEDDLGLDLRFNKSSNAACFALGGQANDGSVIDVGPYRLAYTIPGPHIGIGKADLSSNGNGSFDKPCLVDQVRHRVSGGDVEAAQLRRERLDLQTLI